MVINQITARELTVGFARAFSTRTSYGGGGALERLPGRTGSVSQRGELPLFAELLFTCRLSFSTALEALTLEDFNRNALGRQTCNSLSQWEISHNFSL